MSLPHGPFTLIERRFANKTLDAVKTMQTARKQVVHSASAENLQAQIDLADHIQVIAALTIRNGQGEEAYLNYLEQLKSRGVDVEPIIMHVEANRDVSWIENIGADIKDSWSNLWR